MRNAMHTQASRCTVQTCISKSIPLHHGDRAIVFNAFTVQEDSNWGKSRMRDNEPEPFSDAHDAVLVPLCWNYMRSAGSAARPALPPLAPEADSDTQPHHPPASSSQPQYVEKQITIPQVSTETHTRSSVKRAASPASSPDAATEPQIVKKIRQPLAGCKLEHNSLET